ncbi:MAG: hypothetical protein MUF01_03715 [Bryobacterales bacterium]|jgi:hypothetical protein|nr:hypothetical protein [Bryobacterales bacterium]
MQQPACNAMAFRLLWMMLLIGGVAPTVFGQAAPRQLGVQDYSPITAKERMQWYAVSTARGAVSGSVFSAAWGTANGRPEEYPNTWEGFGRRYRMSVSGVAVGNAMEVGLGAMWGEDPRYFPTNLPPAGNMRAKLKHIIKSTFTAKNRRGETIPAYARLIAQPGNNFLANTWRVDSESTVGQALLRTSFGFLGRMTSNAIAELRNDFSRARRNTKPPTVPGGTNPAPTPAPTPPGNGGQPLAP